MNIRKMNKHRAKLSYEKRWGYFRKDGKLIMWNIRSKEFK